MFHTLLESRATRTRRTGGSVLSIVLHAALILIAVILTGNAATSTTSEAPPDELHFTKVEPPKVIPTPVVPDRAYTAPPLKGFQVLPPVVDIPSVLPDIDLLVPPTNPDDFSGRGRPNGTSTGTDAGTSAPVPTNGIYSEFQVERPVVLVAGSAGPLYPEMLRVAGVEGQVMAQFVVDTTGRANIGSFVALLSDNALFTAAVRTALTRMRFIPAEVDGHKVAQLVQQPFQFSVSR